MASGTVVFIPPYGGNIIQTGPGAPGTFVQPPGMVQYVQYLQSGGQQLGDSSNPPQQNRQAGPLEKLLKVETKTLGAVQIIIGLIHIGFGAVSIAIIGPYYFIPVAAYGGYPFWGGIFFIASGSLSVSAEKHLTSALVKCSVGMNITSAAMASVGIILYIAELALNRHSYRYYGNEYSYDGLKSVGTGLSVLLLLFTLLEFCITVSAAHFGCQAACCKGDQPTMIFVPYPASGVNTTSTEDNPPPPAYGAAVAYPKGEEFQQWFWVAGKEEEHILASLRSISRSNLCFHRRKYRYKGGTTRITEVHKVSIENGEWNSSVLSPTWKPQQPTSAEPSSGANGETSQSRDQDPGAQGSQFQGTSEFIPEPGCSGFGSGHGQEFTCTTEVKSSAGMNIISALAALTGIVLYVLELVLWRGPYLLDHSNGYPHDYQDNYHHEYPRYSWQTSGYISRVKPYENLIGIGLCVLLLLFTILEFCIAVSAAHFGCNATCCNNEPQRVVFLPYTASGADVAPPVGYAAPPPAYEFVDSYPKGE
ncbi:uncharacterized protein LOC134393360 [Elgaria multicarinata webbii]|uniref:uncharacterized protein LOC134393360 n=1 Tax=Elgaria multicarinata webbii TaxID=159646 RepID=UPI002FCCEB7B